MSPRLCALEWEQLLCLRQCTRLIALSLLLKLHYSEAWGRCFCSALFYYCAGKVVVASRGVRNQVQPHAGGNASPRVPARYQRCCVSAGGEIVVAGLSGLIGVLVVAGGGGAAVGASSCALVGSGRPCW